MQGKHNLSTLIFNLQNYWCRQLILPKVVLQRTNQLCSRFSWKGRDEPVKGAKLRLDMEENFEMRSAATTVLRQPIDAGLSVFQIWQ
ncbi:hypothetical protein J1N35_015829 [Gossypium stocksii]|uniref:Uncharacterized protein n=1 Tax=Gossypium stocksii TaxID=47602 RepID=A0A9D3VXV7_9ROSI|nr:hypothetical protein J1N35_015829 [Gossypium stocksii]